MASLPGTRAATAGAPPVAPPCDTNSRPLRRDAGRSVGDGLRSETGNRRALVGSGNGVARVRYSFVAFEDKLLAAYEAVLGGKL